MIDAIDYDLFGHCSCCHNNMLIEQVVGGKVIKRFTADYAEVEYLLNDGSKMRVSVCKPCQEKGIHLDLNRVMTSVVKGWQHEVDEKVKDEKRPDWNQERADAHMEWYGNLDLVTATEGHDADSLKLKLESHPVVLTPDRLLAEVSDVINK